MLGATTTSKKLMLLRPARSRRANAIVLMLTMLFVGPALVGCATTPTTGTIKPGKAVATQAANKAVRCNRWKAITYSGSKDTIETSTQVREHNATGQKAGCWK